MLRPEALGEDAQAEIDAATAEEERAGEEDARGEDPDGGVGAPRQVLVDGARAAVLAREQRERVGDRQHAEARRSAPPAPC